MFISKFGKRPDALFRCTLGGAHVYCRFFSCIMGGYYQKLYAVKHGIQMGLVSNNPYFYIALTAMIIGTQFFLAGFIADLIIAKFAPIGTTTKLQIKPINNTYQ
jgi:hypothetical protein